MQLNNLQSIILNDYVETLEKAIIHKTIDKIATLIAEDVSVSIYQKLLEQSTTNIQSCKDTLSDKNTSSCKDILCENTSCKDTLCKDALSGKNIASCKDKNNTCQCCSEHNSTIGKMRKFNQRHKINKIKVNDQCINDNSNINDNTGSIKNDSIQDNSTVKNSSIKNNSLFDSISSSKNNSQSEYDLSNNANNKNNKDKNDNNNNNKNDIDKVDVILNKLIDILETDQKTNSKASEILSKDELSELFKAAFALNEMCPFHHDEVFKAFFSFK